MSNFSYINAIPLPILDITNTGKTIRDFDVDIARRIKQQGLILGGENSIYFNSDPETETIGSNWPIGMSFEELCYFYWKVGYFNWGGTSARLPFDNGPIYYWGGSYSPSAYPRIAKILNDNCTDYLQKGDLYYAVRIINQNIINGENVETCNFYDLPDDDSVFSYSPIIRLFDFGDSVPSINFDFCAYNSRENPFSNNLALIAFQHPFEFLNRTVNGGDGNPLNIFQKFPRIIKNENLYYPSIYIGSVLGAAIVNERVQRVGVRTFGLMARTRSRLVGCPDDQGPIAVEGIDEQYVSETKLINFEILNTPRSLFVFSANVRIIADGCSLYPLNTDEETLGNILGMKAYEEQPN